jgi:hypothetical protein
MKNSILLIITLLFVPLVSSHAADAQKPNIIFILADDLGLDGVSCHGADIYKTPHIDKLATFAELGGAKLPEGFKYDSVSIAPQLRGEKGTPREWAYVQQGAKWFVREQGWKMNEAGELFDMSDAPFVEKPVAAATDTADSKAARERLGKVLAELNPAAGKTDHSTGAKNKKGRGAGRRKNKQPSLENTR